MAVEPKSLRSALGRFATGVTIMSIRDGDGQAYGVTVNSFVSVSLEPPLILWCLRREAGIHDVFESNDRFAVNILGGRSAHASARYAMRGRIALEESDFSYRNRGAPLMKNALMSFECQTLRRDNGGDHTILLARVLDIHAGRDDEPLVFYNGGYRQLESAQPSA